MLKKTLLASLALATLTATTTQASVQHQRVLDATLGVGEELMERLATSPWIAVPTIAQALQHGEISLDFLYHEANERWGSTTTLHALYQANRDSRQFLISGGFESIHNHEDWSHRDTSWQGVAYIDPTQFVLGLPDLMSVALGINFDNFGNDLLDFATSLGWTGFGEVADLLGVVELVAQVQAFMASDGFVPTSTRALFDNYVELFRQLFFDSELTSEQTLLTTEMELYFSMELLHNFALSLYEAIYHDTELYEQLALWDTITMRSHWRGTSYANLLLDVSGFAFEVAYARAYDPFDLRFTVVVDNHSGRLQAIRGGIRSLDLTYIHTFDLNLGRYTMDDWYWSTYEKNNWTHRETRHTWAIEHSNATFTNATHTLETRHPGPQEWQRGWEHENTQTIHWNPATGRLIADEVDLETYGTIYFVVDGDSFTFMLAYGDCYNEMLLALSAQTGSVTIEVPAHTSLWSLDLDTLMDILEQVGFGWLVWFFI